MNNAKNERVKVYVMIGTLLILLMMFSGITYAFFTSTNNNGSTSIVEVTGGKMTISYTDGTSDILTSKNIVPSNDIIVNKTFTLTGTNTTNGLAMPYKVGLDYVSEFSDGMIHYYIKRTNTNSNVTSNLVGTANQIVPGNTSETGYTHGTLKKGNRYLELATGEFKTNTTNQTITFNLKLQFPDNNDNQDSEKGKSLTGKIVVNYEGSFSTDSWERIANIVKDGYLTTYAVGSEKEVMIDNQVHKVRVANNTTPDECNEASFSQTACGFVVEFVDIVEERRMNSNDNNANGWPGSELYKYLNGDFYNKLPEELRKEIKETKVVSGHGSTVGEINFISTDNVYLLSGHEVYESVNDSSLSKVDTAYNQTRQLDYYKSKGVTTSNYLNAVKQYRNSKSIWWLRTAHSDATTAFLCIDSNGKWYDGRTNPTRGFAPVFRIG